MCNSSRLHWHTAYTLSTETSESPLFNLGCNFFFQVWFKHLVLPSRRKEKGLLPNHMILHISEHSIPSCNTSQHGHSHCCFDQLFQLIISQCSEIHDYGEWTSNAMALCLLLQRQEHIYVCFSQVSCIYGKLAHAAILMLVRQCSIAAALEMDYVLGLKRGSLCSSIALTLPASAMCLIQPCAWLSDMSSNQIQQMMWCVPPTSQEHMLKRWFIVTYTHWIYLVCA